MHIRFLAFAVLAGTAFAACGDSGGSSPDPGQIFDLDAITIGDTTDDAFEVGEEDTGTPPSDVVALDVRQGTDDGLPCTDSDACGGEVCLSDEAFVDGYCTTTGCSDSDDCFGPQSSCVSYEGGNVCAAECEGDEGCRDGYSCLPLLEDGGVCLPTPQIDGDYDGQPCASDEDCIGGTCLEDPDWPQGYCTTLACNTFEDCARGPFDNRCLIQEDTNFCVRLCQQSDECREGYVCTLLNRTQGICIPPSNQSPADPIIPPEVDFDDYPFPIVCDTPIVSGEVEYTFTVSEEATSYIISPVAADGSLQPLYIQRPSGGRIDLQGDNFFQSVPSQLFGFVNPVIVPGISELASQLEPGEHTFVSRTNASQVCFYYLEETSPGTTIDLNVYLVGVPGVDASNVAENPDFNRMFEVFDEIYAAADVAVGEIRYFDVEEDVAASFSVIRNLDTLSELFPASGLPGDTVDDALSLNVFFVARFDAGGTLGVSYGLPGTAGLHGTPVSGVVFTSEFLGGNLGGGVDGTEYTSVILAHEIGHYLGLFHTTEQPPPGRSNPVSFDPISDTPRCESGFPNSCPDLNNLMFPFAGVDHRQVSEGQAFVVQVNPLTKD